MSHKINDFQGFMEKVSDTVRPQSINNTLHSLDQQGIDSNYELHIRREGVMTVEYVLKVYLPGINLQITYCNEESNNNTESYRKVNYLEVTVHTHTYISRESEPHELRVDFGDYFFVKGDNPGFSGGYCSGVSGLIKEVRVIQGMGD